ncbi:MAG: hypothetical protein KAW88_10195, partial [Candidatus Cloacimonetes bacterium]|nr:hypothetical protein [Candidatus Cloacimonadota bacterium]
MKRIFIFSTCFIFLLGIISGCASMKTSKKQFSGINKKLEIRDFAGAISQIESSKDKFYKEKEKVLYYLDLGMLYHYNKEYKKSNEFLEKAEFAIEELYTKSISKAAVSLLLNDNAMDYSGEDYEDIYLNVFKALNYLELNKFDEAFVEIRRINNKLSVLEDKHVKMAAQFNLSKDKKNEFKTGKSKFHNSALGRYLSLLLYRAEGKRDDARIDLNKIRDSWELQKQICNFEIPEMDNYLNKTDKARIDILSFIGKSPDKKAKTLYIHTETDVLIIATTKEAPDGTKKSLGGTGELVDATKEMVDSTIELVDTTKELVDSIIDITPFKPKKKKKEEAKIEAAKEEDKIEATLDIINWSGIQKGYHFKFQLPYMDLRKSQVAKIKVFVDDKLELELEPIESVENVALETYKVKEPLIYLKTITRSVVKGLLAEKAKVEMEKKTGGGYWGLASRLATDLAVDATENADLRISRFFPAKALIGEIEVEPGIHFIKIEYYS